MISREGGRLGKGSCLVGGWGHLRIHLLLDNSQEDFSPTLESCEVCGSAHTLPGNWKRSRGWEGEGGEEGQVTEGDKPVRKEEDDGGLSKRRFGYGEEKEGREER